MPTHDEFQDQLAELIAIPSVSADPAHAGDVEHAADGSPSGFARAGGAAEVVPWNGGRPLVIGEVRRVRARRSPRPTVLCYAHFDVQPPDPLELWESPPFELTRPRRLALRTWSGGRQGATVHARRGGARSSPRPASCRSTCASRFDGEEEVGGHSIVEWVAAGRARRGRGDHPRRGHGPSGSADVLRGAARNLYFHVQRPHRRRPTCTRACSAVRRSNADARADGCALRRAPRADGRLPDDLRAGSTPPSARGARGMGSPASGRGAALAVRRSARSLRGAAEEFYVRTFADRRSTSTGSRAARRTSSRRSFRSKHAPTSRSASRRAKTSRSDSPAFEQLVREATPAGAVLEIDVTQQSREPGSDADGRSGDRARRATPSSTSSALGRSSSGSAARCRSYAGLVGTRASDNRDGVRRSTRVQRSLRRTRTFPEDALALGVEDVRETFTRLGQLGLALALRSRARSRRSLRTTSSSDSCAMSGSTRRRR